LLVLYSLLLRHDRRDVATTALAIVLATSLAMAHPITPIFAILAIVIAKLFMPVFRWLTRHAFVRASETSAERTPRMRMLFVYLTVTYLTWTGILTFALQGSLERLAFAIKVGGLVNPIQYGRFLTVDLVLKLYGAMGILGFYWLSGMFLVWKRGGFHFGLATRLAASVVFGALLLAAAFQVIASGLGIAGSATVPLTIAFMFLPVLGGTFLKTVGFERDRGRRSHVILAAAVLIPFVLGAAAMYPSPYISLFNYQNTQQVYSSIEWSASYLPSQSEILS